MYTMEVITQFFVFWHSSRFGTELFNCFIDVMIVICWDMCDSKQTYLQSKCNLLSHPNFPFLFPISQKLDQHLLTFFIYLFFFNLFKILQTCQTTLKPHLIFLKHLCPHSINNAHTQFYFHPSKVPQTFPHPLIPLHFLNSTDDKQCYIDCL